jgi:hypothetical protein
MVKFLLGPNTTFEALSANIVEYAFKNSKGDIIRLLMQWIKDGLIDLIFEI